MSRIKKTVAQWLAGRKFTLCLLYVIICLTGGSYLCWKADSFDEKFRAVELSFEYSLFGVISFMGIEGAADLMGRIKGKIPLQPNQPPYTTDTTT